MPDPCKVSPCASGEINDQSAFPYRSSLSLLPSCTRLLSSVASVPPGYLSCRSVQQKHRQTLVEVGLSEMRAHLEVAVLETVDN